MRRRSANRFLRRAEYLPTTYMVVEQQAPGGLMVPQPVTVPSWTSSGGLWYYDLEHGRGREMVYLVGYDTMEKEYIGFWEKLEPDATDPTTKLRIWLSWDPGANRIKLLYF